MNVVEEVMQRIKKNTPEEQINEEIVAMIKAIKGQRLVGSIKCSHPKDIIVVSDVRSAIEINNWQSACGHNHLVLVGPVHIVKGSHRLAVSKVIKMCAMILDSIADNPDMAGWYKLLKSRVEDLLKDPGDGGMFESVL